MPIVPYVKQTWTDGVSSGSAARFAVIESGVHEVSLAPAVRVFHSANQTLTTSVEAALAFNSERFDTAAGAAATHHDTATNNSRLTVLYAGKYLVSGTVRFAANATGARQVRVRLNGATFIAAVQIPTSSAGSTTTLNVTALYDMAVNDYVELMAFQTSGGDLAAEVQANISPEFMMVRVA